MVHDENVKTKQLSSGDLVLHDDLQVLDVLDPTIPKPALLCAVDVRLEEVDTAERKVLRLRRR